MESIPDRAAAVLARHPSPALSLSELTVLLRDDAPGIGLRPGAILDLLSRHPERFRIVRASAGLRSLAGTLCAEDRPPPARAATGPVRGRSTRPDRGPWVLGLEPRTTVAGWAPLDVLRATLAYLGLRLDEESGRAVARWMGFVAECSRVMERARRQPPA